MNPKTMMSAIMRIAILALLLPVGMLAAQTTDSEAITKLMLQVKAHATQADEDAATLESYTRGRMHFQSHATQITRIKEHVNDLIRDSNEMSSIRHLGSPWQQEMIDHVNELLPQISSHLTAMIVHLKENQSRTMLPPFRDYVLQNQRLINKAHEMINDYMDYGAAKSRAEALEKELQLSTDASAGQ
jgi:wobble nucleotide-excising tRNase